MFITRKRFEEEISRAEKRAFETACQDQRLREIERDLWLRCEHLDNRITRLEKTLYENP